MKFRTHLNEIVEGERLQKAVNTVADEMMRNAHAIRAEDAYASHVTEPEKEKFLADRLQLAEDVRAGRIDFGAFWLWQSINTALTGECVPLFSD